MFSHIFPASETKTGWAELVQPVCEPYLLTHDDAKTFVDVTSPARDPTNLCVPAKSPVTAQLDTRYTSLYSASRRRRGEYYSASVIVKLEARYLVISLL